MRENTSKLTACSTRTPVLVCTCADTSRICASIALKKIPPVRLRMSSKGLVDRDLAQQVEVGQHAPRSEHHRRKRIFRHRQREPGLLAKPLVQVLEHRSAARQHDAAV